MQKTPNVRLFDIFKIFFKIGLILLGGGYVILPIAKAEFIEKRNWLNEDELLDFYCVSQCLPGIIAINMSILIGYKLRKTFGALSSVFGLCFSPVVIILIISKFLEQIANVSFLGQIFWAVNISVIILIYLTLKEMWQKSISDKFCLFWFSVIFILSFFKISPVVLVILSIFIAIVFYGLEKAKIIKKKDNENA